MPNSMKQTHDMNKFIKPALGQSSVDYAYGEVPVLSGHHPPSLPMILKARPVPRIMQIPGGRYAVISDMQGGYSSLHKVYRSIYEEWFPKSKYHPPKHIQL